MCAHNLRDAGENKSSKSLQISTNFVYIIHEHGSNKITMH